MNERQRRFVLEYLVDGNATEAYLRAGYKPSARRTAESAASQLLRNPRVAHAIVDEQEERGKRTKATADRVLLEIERIALVDPSEFDGVKSLRDLKRLPARLRRAVVGWSWDKRGNFVLKLAKEAMLAKLGSHHKLFTDIIEHKITSNLGRRLDNAKKRIAAKAAAK